MGRTEKVRECSTLERGCAQLGIDLPARATERLLAHLALLERWNRRVIHARVEEYRPARKFDTLAARAFAPLPRTLQLTAALRRPGVRLLAMKGRMPAAEIAAVDGGAGAAGNADGAGADGADAQSVATVATETVAITVQRLTVPFLRAERHLIIAAF